MFYRVCTLLLLSTFPGMPLLNAQSRSQKTVVTWGPEFKTGKRALELGIVQSDATGTYNLMREGGLMSSRLTLQKFDSGLRLVKTEEQVYRQLDMPLELRFMLPLNNELIAFTSRAESKDDKHYLFYSRVDKNTLLESGYAEKIAGIDYKPGLFSMNKGSYQHSISENQSKVLVYYQQPYEKGRSEKFGFQVYDNQMRKLWERDVELPYNDELFSVEHIYVGNNGAVYVIGKISAKKRADVEKGTPGYSLVILVYDRENGEPGEYPVYLGEKFITDIRIAIGDNNDITCAGFYSESGTGSIKGSFFLTISAATKKITRQSHSEFPLDFITLGLKENKERKLEKKAGKGKNVELPKYNLREIIQRKDGGAVLVGEQYWVDVVTTTSTGPNGTSTTRSDYYYHYNDIIVINIGPDGVIEWNRKIPKRQLTANDFGTYSSYALMVMDERLFFIFNDHPQNLFYTEGIPVNFSGNRKKMLPLLVEIDRAGNVEREALIHQDDTDLAIHPRNSTATNSGEMILYAHEGKTHQLARVQFK